MYESPYWMIDLIIDKDEDQISENEICSYKAKIANHTYATRSKSLNEIDDQRLEVEGDSLKITEVSEEPEKNTEQETAPEKIASPKKIISAGFDDSVADIPLTAPSGEVEELSNDVESNELERVDTNNQENIENMQTNFEKAYIWHAKLGHASVRYLREFQKRYRDNKELSSIVFDERLNDCEVCMLSKINRLPFKSVRKGAVKPLEIIPSDVMGPITPVTFPQGYKFIVTFIDDYSRVALAYAVRHKNETAKCLELFVKMSRNVIGYEAKVCYLRSDQGTESTGNDMLEVLNQLGAESQLTPPDTPELNGVAERINQTIQKKVRSYMCDSKLPANMWNLALGAVMYSYNRTPHSRLNMEIPLKRFTPDYSIDITQIKRFGCIAYMKVQRHRHTKFGNTGTRAIMVGYTRMGYVLYKPENGKYYETRDVRFNEKLVYGDKFKTNIEKGNVESIDFDQKDTLETEGVEQPAAPLKRSRGRPRKGGRNTLDTTEMMEKVDPSSERINDSTRTDYVEIEENDMCYIYLANKIEEPESYDEAMLCKESKNWSEAIQNELNSMENNEVWKIVERPSVSRNGGKPNIIDSRWVLKKKYSENAPAKYRARLVVRGCKDKNSYELTDTYAPVSRLTLVRSVLAIINKLDLDTCQLDVKTAFLNGEISEEIYMEIPKGMRKVDRNKVCKLQKALYGLKISPKRWNEKFTEIAHKVGLTSSELEPCLFTWRNEDKFLILLLYVDDMLMASNSESRLKEVKLKLMNEFEMSDMGEPREFLGFKIERNRKERTLHLSQEKYIEAMLDRFGFGNLKPQSTPMESKKVQEIKRKERNGL